ncbi:MAG: hypothetical protein M3237_21505 [Actinomycetota bacterium]|nr:hypothetical protein [Actinomycetota bacterium]
MRRVRALSVAALLGIALPPALAAAPAAAKPVERGEFHEELSQLIENFCDVPGLTVIREAEADGRFRVNTHGREQLPFYAEHAVFSEVLTNPATGLSVRAVERSLGKDLSLDLDGDILTVVFLATGNATIYGPDGKAIARNPGQVRFRVVIDTQGTLDDFSDDVELSFEQIKGSTGRSDDFCEAVVGAIG